MKRRNTLRAAAELDEVLAYIDERSPQGARNVKARIQAVINLTIRNIDGEVTLERGVVIVLLGNVGNTAFQKFTKPYSLG